MRVCHVFAHVPKCGGTSLLTRLRETSLRLVEDYASFDGVDFAVETVGAGAARDLRRGAAGQEMRAPEADLIWGHFPLARYQGPDYRYVTLIRDPLERMISNYHADGRFAAAHPESDTPRAKLGARILRGEVSILGYLRQSPQARGVYRRFLGAWGAHQFALVGRTDRYEIFAEALGERLGVDLTMPVRQPKPYAELDLTARERDEARRLLQEEYLWFDRLSEAAV